MRRLLLLLCIAFPLSAAPLRLVVLDSQGGEGDAGTKTLSFVYMLPFPVNGPVTGNYHTVDGTATAADNDYIPVAEGSFTIPPGETNSTPISVTIVGDRRFENDETFTIVATDVQGANTPPPNTITILNDDGPPTFSVTDGRVTEGNSGVTLMTFDVTLSLAAGVPIQLGFATANGTATAGSDYVAAQGTLTFQPGTVTRRISIEVNGDTAFEPDETFTLTATREQTAVTGTGTIVNDDTRPIARVAIAGGNNQAGRLGERLGQPLVVQVLNDDGGPVPGVTVQWRVTQGRAQLQPGTSVTGADGRASTSVTLESVGTITIEAAVANIAPVIFTLGANTGFAGRAQGPVAVPIARALDQLCARDEPAFNAVCRALSALPDGSLTSTLERVAPQQSGAQAQVSGAVVSAVTSSIGSRLAAVRGGERFSLQRMSVTVDRKPILIASLANVLLPQSDDTTAAEDADYNGWSAFLSGNLGSGERQSRFGALGFDLESRGVMAGLDRQFGDNIFGVSLNWMSLDAELQDNAGSLDTTGYALSVYASRGGLFSGSTPSTGAGFDGVHLDGMLSLGQNNYEAEHIVEIASLPVSRATSENDARIFAASAVIGVDAHRGRNEFDLSLSGTWSQAQVDELTEEGGGPLILFVERHDVESLTGALSANLRSTWPVPFGTLTPSLRGEFVHEFMSGSRLVTARFLRDRLNTSFTIPVDRPDSNYGRVAAGLQAGFPRGVTAFVEVTQDVLRSDLHFRALQFTVQKSF
ncbi:MAG TPA: autotransporter domain-containing protein [Thermoanaerobaculia bacterium]